MLDLNTGFWWQQGDGQNEESRDWEAACDYCESLELGGYTDWALPESTELQTVALYGGEHPTIDPTAFPDCLKRLYWSNTPVANDPRYHWMVDFFDGDMYPESSKYYVRCMRRPPIESICPWAGSVGDSENTQFQADGGTITDTALGLVWQKSYKHEPVYWNEAMSYCESLVLEGYEDWRLPNARELASIVDHSRVDPAIDPSFDCRSSRYWTSTTYEPNPAFAFQVDFYRGEMRGQDKDMDPIYVRCVRGGPVEPSDP